MSDNIYKEFMGRTVNLLNYDTNFPIGSLRDTLFLKGTWKQWKWLFIGDWEIDDPRLRNLGIRAEQNKKISSDEMAYDFELNGFKTNFLPPVIGTDGDIRGGRTRIIAAIKKKQQWIPVAVYYFEETDTPTKDKVTEGLREQHAHSPLTRSSTDDFVAAGIASIDSGELKRDEDDIMNWLVNEAEVALRFSNEGGQFKRIVNQIIDATSGKDNLTRILDRAQWLEWLKQVNGYSSDWVLYKAAKKQTDSKLIWCDHILPNEFTPELFVPKEGKWQIKGPTKIVLYTDKLTADKCSDYIENFKQDLDDMYTKSYSLIDSNLGGTLNKTLPSVKPYQIVGICPNLHRCGQDELYDNFQLVDADTYIHDGSAISSALNTVHLVA